MTTIAYLANQFPSPVEPYVAEEILELRRRGIRVLPCSARSGDHELETPFNELAAETLFLLPSSLRTRLRAFQICIRHAPTLIGFARRAVFRRKESVSRKLRALAHTWLGVCYAALLAKRGVQHIHVHHGYFSCWITMVAARLLGVGFSMTLHGSDLLCDAAFLDLKLAECKFCVTISDYNRKHILGKYPGIRAGKILVRRLGVEVPLDDPPPVAQAGTPLVMLAVGRLHPVKDHAFLIRACRLLYDRGLPFLCLIAGEGPERKRLNRMIADLHLQATVRLLGHLPRSTLQAYYHSADLVVLTSRSEGLPLVLMEAMSHSKPVLAPAITGIPELVVHGWTGFLYRQGSLADFVAQVEQISKIRVPLAPVCECARQHIARRFNRERNLEAFADTLLDRINQPPERECNAGLVL